MSKRLRLLLENESKVISREFHYEFLRDMVLFIKSVRCIPNCDGSEDNHKKSCSKCLLIKDYPKYFKEGMYE